MGDLGQHYMAHTDILDPKQQLRPVSMYEIDSVANPGYGQGCLRKCLKEHWVASQASRVPNQVATGQRSGANGMPGVNEV